MTKLICGVSLAILLLAGLPGSIFHAPSAALAAGELDVGDEIVYVGDKDAFTDCILVLDPYQTGGTAPNTNPEVKFSSDKWECDWRDIALGDFNNDGDMEIVAIGGDSSTGKLAVFDPVVADSSISPVVEINGIPAARLYSRTIPEGKPVLVGAGNLDDGIPGDEIFYTIDLNGDDDTRVVILKSTTLTPNGTSWTEHINSNFGGEWDQVAIGNIDEVGTDEVILVDKSGEMGAYRPVNNFSRFYRFSDSSPWRSAAIGQVYPGGPMEVVASRNSDTLASLFIFQYSNDSFTEASGDAMSFAPYPRHVFVADVNNSGDDEVLFLRRDSSPRLIMRNRGSDLTIKIEEALDSDDGYVTGVGGDLKGDGIDMIVIGRDNNIRIYTTPNVSVDGSTIRNFGVDTNRRSLVAGDVDKIGFISGPEFAATPSSFATTLPQETFVSEQFTIKLENIGTPNPAPFTFQVGASGWVTVTVDKFITPANFKVEFNATDLPVGAHKVNLTVNSSDPDAVNTPYQIPLTLNVSNAKIEFTPGAADFVYTPCSQFDSSADNVREISIAVGGTIGTKYTAGVYEGPALAAADGGAFGSIIGGAVDGDEVTLYDDRGNVASVPREQFQSLSASAVNDTVWPDGPDWITSVTSTGPNPGVVPDTLKIVVDPSQITGPFIFEQAPLVLIGGSTAGYIPDNIRILPITARCVESVIFLPYLAR